MSILDNASKKFAEIQQKTSNTISVYKMQSKIKELETDIMYIYASIGEIVYKAHKAEIAPEGAEAMYEKIDSLNAEIAELRAKIDFLNKVVRCPECGEAVAKGVNFCHNCGCRISAEKSEAVAPETVVIYPEETENNDNEQE